MTPYIVVGVGTVSTNTSYWRAVSHAPPRGDGVPVERHARSADICPIKRRDGTGVLCNTAWDTLVSRDRLLFALRLYRITDLADLVGVILGRARLPRAVTPTSLFPLATLRITLGGTWTPPRPPGIVPTQWLTYRRFDRGALDCP